MNLLVAENLTKYYGDRTIFENISFGINEGDKVGLLGINGTGKSTLLKVLAGAEESDTGTITMKTGLRVSYLAQNPIFDDSVSVLENVWRGKTASESYRNLEGEASALLKKLGIEDPTCKPSILSGGQRKRAALVRTLLTDSDFLILDEPTNHLDAEMTEWLEETLKAYKGAFICVTHDRYFLDEVTNRIFELDKRSLYSYVTNYSGFVELKAEREDIALATERKAKSLFKTELAWMMRGARARSTKQKAHIQRFEALRDRKKIETTDSVEITSAYSRLGKKTIECAGLAKSFDTRCIIKDFSYIFLQNDRIGIIGPNGCGKSTLVKMITGSLKPDAGSVELGSTVKLGIFSQECEEMNKDQKAIDYIRDTAEMITTKEGVITASRMLENFLFTGSMQYSPIGKLSGGERRRLYLLKILMSAPNVLILDEPTNDLDIMTLTILEDYLKNFEGIVIAVSHDRYFLDKLVNRIFVFRGDGVIAQVEGNYTDYREKELERAEEEAERQKDAKQNKSKNISPSATDASSNNSVSKNTQSKKLKFSYNEQREFDSIDADIEALENDIAALDEDIATSSTDYYKLNELLAKKEELQKQLDYKTERWIYLNDLADEIAKNKSSN